MWRKKLFCHPWSVRGPGHSDCPPGPLYSLLKFLFTSDRAATGYRNASGQLHGDIFCNGACPDVPHPRIMMPGVSASPLPLEHEAMWILWEPGQESAAKGKQLLPQTPSPATPDFILPREKMWQDHIFSRNSSCKLRFGLHTGTTVQP